MVATRTTFEDYFHEYLYPYVRSKNPGVTESDLIERLSFKPIESFLRKADNIGLLHNRDDIILDDGDIDRLQGLFGARAKIFPQGGHCGNLNHAPVVRYLVSFFSAKDH